MSKKLITIISSAVALIGLVTSLLLLIPNECKHEYDHACDSICNLCEEERTIEHDWKNADCINPKTCNICQTQEGEALGHDWTTPDVDQCEVQSTCSRCGVTEGENKEHVYDNDCDISCNICDYIRTTEHSPNEDDGDCTTEIICSICGAVTTPAKSVHIPNGDDNDCSTAVSCSVCNQIIIEAKNHDFSGNWEKDASGHWHVCKNTGCNVIDKKENHISDGAATEEKAEKCTLCEYIITPELDHTHNHNIAMYNTEYHWIECACGDKSAVTDHTSNDDDGDCTTAVICSGCAYVTTAARTSHEAGADDGNCTTPIICKYCTKIAVASNVDHAPNSDDGDCTTPIDCSVCGTIIIPATDGHSAEPDDHDCTTATKCVTCEKILVEARNEHTGGMATCGVKAVCEFCNTPYGELEPDNHLIVDGSCACGEKWYIDATKLTAEQLNAAVTEKLEAGETDIEIVLAPDAPAEMITAIRRAICDTEGVADGSINLTLKGVTVIPDDPNHEGVGFAERWGQWDENNVEIVSNESVTQLASINLPDVLTIGYFAFSFCENLTKVIAPNVQTIGWHALQYTALTTVEFPELTTIPYALFAGTSTLTSAKFPNVTVVENGGLLIGRVLAESILLELTTEGDISFNGNSHFNVSSQNYSNKVDLVLHANKRTEVIFNDDGTATWKGYTFKSISFTCLDGTTNHDYQYSDNGDGTHNFGCTICDDKIIETHTIVDHVCTDCGAMEIIVNFDADDYEWKTGDELLLCRISRDNEWEEYCFTANVAADGTVTWTPDKTLYWDGTGEHRLIISYPCTAIGWDDFVIPDDQSDVEKLRESDLMNARWTGTPTTNVINFELKHRMAKITIKYLLASQFESIEDVTAEIYSNAKYIIFSDADELPMITSVGQYDAWLTPYYTGEDIVGYHYFTVYVTPGEYNTDGLFKFYIDGAEVQIEIGNSGDVTLEEGGEYTFEVKVGKNKVNVLTEYVTISGNPGGWTVFAEENLNAKTIIGTPSDEKNDWAVGDQVYVTLHSDYFGTQTYVYTYDGNGWEFEDDAFRYLEDEIATVTAIYAPCYEYDWFNEQLVLTEGMKLGMTEYIVADCKMDNWYSINVNFSNVIPNYSRLRIVGQANTTYKVNATSFTPAGEIETGTYTYTITTDENGNAYLYGLFIEDATVTVEKGEETLTNYTFATATEANKSYALEARAVIDGTLGGKSVATEEDINALVEQFKVYVDNGITTIIVTGNEPACIYIDYLDSDMPAVSEALYRLTNEKSTSVYCGTIDLILPDATFLTYMEFCSTYALNSVTLPKVTKLADQAFHDTPYLRTITFGSVLTEVNETGGVMFALIGYKVGGCDLILNCGQMNESSVSTPDLTTNIWRFKYNNEFKSITLIHTGECDDCKANK